AVDSNEHALDETHAGAPAAGQSHSGKIQRRPAKDEPEDDGTLEAKQGQSGRGLSAYADSASHFLRVLPDAANRHRTARRPFFLGLRLVAGRYRLGHSGAEFPPQPAAAHHGRDPDLADAPDAALARRRSRAAEDD